jgi:hypothetical protein
MPHFHFTVYVHLVKFGETPVVMSKQVMDIYLPVIMSVVYSMSQGYLDRGWIIERYECKDFTFLPDITMSWGD